MVTNLKAAWQSTEILTTTYDYKVLEKLQTTKAGSKAVYYKPSRLVTANKYSSFFTRLKIILSLCFFSSSSTLKFRIALKQLKEIKETAQGLQQRAKAIHQQAFILNGGQAHKDQFFKALHEFEELLADDLKTGRVIVAQESLDISYPNFYILKDKAKIVLAPRDYHEWKQQYRQIINRAFLKQTLSKKSEWERTYAANVLLQQLYKVTIQQKDKRYLVEKQALEALVHDESLMCLPLYDFAKQVEETKLTAWLKACGITDDAAIRAHKNIIHELENYYQQLEKKSECIKSHLPDISWLAKVAPKQYQFILNSYQNQILRINKRILRHFIHKVWKNPETAQLFSLSSDQEHSTQLVHLSRRFDSFIEHKLESKKIYEKYGEKIEVQIKFYENWSKCLVKELIQGFPSEDEALGDGVCFAVAVRWALSDGFHLPTSLKSFLAVPSLDSIKAQDRYYQAFYEISSEKNLKANEILNNKIPYLQEFELNEVCYVDSVNCTANDFSIKFKEILHSEKFINKKSNPGVGLLIQNFPDSAHAIYFRYDPHLGVYRFGDPNVGLFQFNNEEEFLTCFQDLITLMYDNLKSINIRQVFQK